MSKYKAKMTENDNSVTAFIRAVPDKQKQEDAFTLIELITKHSGLQPKMWGASIIGFGKYHYKYESGHEGDSPLIAFSPRKSSIVLYMSNFQGREKLLENFGKHTTSVACIYFKKLADINIDVLEKMIPISIEAATNNRTVSQQYKWFTHD